MFSLSLSLQDTAEILYDVMRGFFLPDPKMVEEQKAFQERRKKNASMYSNSGERRVPHANQPP